MRVVTLVAAVFSVGLFCYAVVMMTGVSVAVRPEEPKARFKPPTLAESAPEALALRAKFRELAQAAQQWTALCPNRDEESEPARPRGKVLIWDVERQDVSDAHGRLPAELRLQSADAPCTVYLITGRERRALFNYAYDPFHGGGQSGAQGFRTDLMVCAVDLPSGQPRGRYRINGNGPPQIVTLQPGDKEIDEDWAGNLQRWIESCVRGPEARYYNPPQQAMARRADEARAVLDQCEMLGSLPRLPNMPPQAIIWNPQTDRWHPAHGRLRATGDGHEERLLMVMVLEDEFVAEQGTGRFDYRVALVCFPGANPLGVYQIRGESWPLPAKRGESWSPSDPNLRDPSRALANWVDRLCLNKGSLPEGTLTLAGDATHLAGGEWLKGPGWLKRLKTGELPAEKKGWEQMAEECSAAVAACRAKGSPARVLALPKKIVVWTDYGETFCPSPAQQALPKGLQAAPGDREVLLALIVGADYVTEPKDAPQTERFDHQLALFSMPGAKPIGVYHVRGETLDFRRNRHAPNAKSADTNQDIASWLKRFVESPQAVALQSAVK